MDKDNYLKIIAWLKVIQSMNLNDFDDFIIRNLFHEERTVRRFAIQTIGKNLIKKGVHYLYNLFKQSDSDQEKKLILSILTDLSDRETARHLFKLISATTILEHKVEILNIVSQFPEIRGIEEVVTELATQEGEDQIKFAAIFNLATLGNYMVLTKMIDKRENERESFLALTALSANLEENRSALHDLEKISKKSSEDLDNLTRLRRNILLVKKIIKNRLKDFKNFSRELQFAFINAFIETRERGLSALTRVIFTEGSIEDKLYLLDIIDLKFSKIIEKEKLLMQLANVRLEASSIRQKIILIFQLISEKQLLSVKEESFSHSIIQKLFIKLTAEFYYYFDSVHGEKDAIKKMGNFLFLHGNAEIRKLLNVYADGDLADKKILRNIVISFFESSNSFAIQELKSFVFHLRTEKISLRKRILNELNSIQFDKAILRNSVLIFLEIISCFKVKKITEKIFKLYRLSLEHKDRELTLACLRTLSTLNFSPVFQEIMRHWTSESFLPREELLISIGQSRNPRALELLIKLFNNKLIGEAHLGQAIEVMGEIFPSGHVLALSILHNFFQNPGLNESIIIAMGKIGNVQTMEYLIDVFLAQDNRVNESLVLDAICAIAKRQEKDKNEIIDNLYKILKKTSDVSRARIMALLVLFADDYIKKVLREVLLSAEQTEIDYFFSYLYSLLESLSSEKLQDYIPYIIDFIQLLNQRLDLADGLAQLITLFDTSHRKSLLPYIQKECGIIRKGDVVVEEEIREISEKKRFIEERENQRELSLFFADIMGYTKKSSELSILDVMELVRNYENIALPIIEKNNGKIIKKMGDGIMVTFQSPHHAVNAGLIIQEKLTRLNQYRLGIRRIIVRIGINSGTVYLREGDVFGDTVNLASRMETNAKPGTILITRATYELIKEKIYCEKLPMIQVKGKDKPVECYRPIRVIGSFDALAAANIAKAPGMDKPQIDTGSEPEQLQIRKKEELLNLFDFFHSQEGLFGEEGKIKIMQFFDYLESLDESHKEKKAIEEFMKNSFKKSVQALKNKIK